MIREHDSRRRKTTISSSFTLLNITVDRKAKRRNSVSQTRSSRDEIINIELTVAVNNLNSAIIRAILSIKYYAEIHEVWAT